MVLIGNINHKALWDRGAGRCVMPYDCYQNIPTKYKSELFASKLKIKAANGTYIKNNGKCDITFVIGDEIVYISFPLLTPVISTDYIRVQFFQSIPHRHLVGSTK